VQTADYVIIQRTHNHVFRVSPLDIRPRIAENINLPGDRTPAMKASAAPDAMILKSPAEVTP
jgi:hypothetical protein